MERRLLIFDFDGTLADTFDLFLDVFDEAAALYRFEPFDRDNLDYLRTLDARSILQYHRVPAWKLPVIAQTTRKLMERHVEAIRLFAGIESTIANLHDRGATLALLSSNSRSNAISVLGHEMASHFDYMECGVSIFGKRAKLRNLLARSGFAAAGTILIGDEIRDAKAASRAGVAFGAVSWGYTAIETLLKTGAREYFSSPGELTRKLMP
jgi:phosphoglycolate phosphatase